MAINELALFTGTGGGLLGTHLLGWRPVCAVEIEPYCREVLLRRQRDGLLDLFPIWDDIRTFSGREWNGLVDVVTAGFPCQPYSAAGRRLGEADARNLWPDTVRIIREVKPPFALLENVPGLLWKSARGYFRSILSDLAESGYDAIWDHFPASAVGAPHRRDRVWILAYSLGSIVRNESGGSVGQSRDGTSEPRGDGEAQFMADAPGQQSDERYSGEGSYTVGQTQPGGLGGSLRDGEPASWWATEPNVGRVANELAAGLDRFRQTLNGNL